MTIALGITTFNRPEMLEKSAKSVAKHLLDVVDYIFIYDDHSDDKHNGAYKRALKALPDATYHASPANHGVAYAKNWLLRQGLDVGADWVFLLEDDIKITDAKAVTEYVRVAKANDLHHLSFAHHGPANLDGAMGYDGDVAYYAHSIGAWTLFSRECLESAGLLDENFHNAWEHVEHELRLIQAGFMPGAGVHRFPDVIGSASWLQELPNSIEKSSIRPRNDWSSSIRDGLIYWRDNKPETFAMLFGDGMPLQQYALNIIG